jgi:hypothetical protein
VALCNDIQDTEIRDLCLLRASDWLVTEDALQLCQNITNSEWRQECEDFAYSEYYEVPEFFEIEDDYGLGEYG